MHIVLRITTVAILVVGTTICKARAQFLQTELPHSFNEVAGTGYPGNTVTGGMDGTGARSPAIAHGIPTAYGADFGDLLSGVAYQRYLGPSIPERNDGAVFMGVGIGDVSKTIGFEIVHAHYDLLGEPLTDGSLSLKVHRRLYEGLAVAVGVESAIQYGGDIAGKSAYAVASQTVQIDGRFLTGASATVGIGDGRFNTMSNLSERDNKLGFFGGGSFQVMNRVNVLGTWYGQDLNIGLSVVVPSPLPITLTPVWVSVLNGQPTGNRFALSIGTSYRFR